MWNYPFHPFVIPFFLIITHPKCVLHWTVEAQGVVLDYGSQHWRLAKDLLDLNGRTGQQGRGAWSSNGDGGGSSSSGCSSGGGCSGKGAFNDYWRPLAATLTERDWNRTVAGRWRDRGRRRAGSGRGRALGKSIVVGGHYERGVRAELMVVTVAAAVRMRVRMMRQLRSLVPGTMHNHLSYCYSRSSGAILLF